MSESELKRVAREAAFRKLQVAAAWGTLSADEIPSARAVQRAKAILGAETEEQLLELATNRDLWERELNSSTTSALWRYRGWDPDAGAPLND